MSPAEGSDEVSGKAAVDTGLFRVVASSASDGIVVIDSDSRILFANESTAQMFGYRTEELVGASLTLLMPEYLRHLHEAAIDLYLRTGERHVHWGGVELPGLHRDGHEIPLELSFGESVEGGRRLFTGIIRDITERKGQRRRLQALYEIALILAGDTSQEEVTQGILETVCRCLDWEVGVYWGPDEHGNLVARQSWCETPELQPFLAETYRQVFTTGLGIPGRASESKKSIWVRDLQADDNFPRMEQAHAAGLHSAFAVPILSDEHLVGVMEFYTSDEREQDEVLLNLLDSTAVQFAQFLQRRQAEEELVRLNSELESRITERTSQLRESNEELESFVNSVSHDLRAPLRGIAGFSEILLEDYGDRLDETSSRYLGRIRGAASRMGELIDDLLNLSRISRSRIRRERTDLSRIAEEVVHELRLRTPERQVEVHIEPGLVVEGDPGLLRIALENLVENSWKFTTGTHSPCIDIGCTPIGGKNVFHVRDNGAGFDPQYSDKLFKPFQRLHTVDQFQGTGIGLTTVSRIVQRHGGSIWAEARVGEGATFYFTL